MNYFQKEVKVEYRFLDTNYHINLSQTGKNSIIVDGKKVEQIELINPGGEIQVEVDF